MHSSLAHSPTPSAASPAPGPIDPATRMGTVRLRVADLARVTAFYETVLGLHRAGGESDRVRLSAGEHGPLIELVGDPSARPRDPRSPGLFHLALLMPDRDALAVALARLATHRWPLEGASDHLVSEALYLSDPEGNGIEIYRDRPREQWPRAGEQLQMATLPLDLEDLASELAGSE